MLHFLVAAAVAAFHPAVAVALAFEVAVVAADFAAGGAVGFAVAAAELVAGRLSAAFFVQADFAVAAVAGFEPAVGFPAVAMACRFHRLAGAVAFVLFPCFYGWFFRALLN